MQQEQQQPVQQQEQQVPMDAEEQYMAWRRRQVDAWENKTPPQEHPNNHDMELDWARWAMETGTQGPGWLQEAVKLLELARAIKKGEGSQVSEAAKLLDCEVISSKGGNRDAIVQLEFHSKAAAERFKESLPLVLKVGKVFVFLCATEMPGFIRDSCIIVKAPNTSLVCEIKWFRAMVRTIQEDVEHLLCMIAEMLEQQGEKEEDTLQRVNIARDKGLTAIRFMPIHNLWPYKAEELPDSDDGLLMCTWEGIPTAFVTHGRSMYSASTDLLT